MEMIMARVLPTLLAGLIAVAGLGLTVAPFEPAAAQETAKKSEKPLRGVVRYKRIGGYSYKYQDTIMSPSESRRFTDPGSARQSVSGPFDSGFFFDSAITKNGGDAPYMQ
jgi:hypothetical protein